LHILAAEDKDALGWSYAENMCLNTDF